jgi:hypothetical protein
VDGEDIRSSGLVNGRLMMDYAEVLLWSASGPIARRVFGSFMTAGWSECWKTATRRPVGRIL